ncbi:MarR family winged helix-turn-helix transcriptional regulator [Acetobacterium tundrae]|uniref:MarR family transcriptional regulator n=1 Tax=Acetobacterium tundrae TaxID=132932 RepID=A0ABR6WPK2_9FIRM|nr:MarR family transcriptional regulator [Acetobacterium tundrae]MBC3798389.1 MarR family transcriptional regulator [Acetobacterium tundrae]
MENPNPWSEIISLLQSAESKLAKARVRAFESHGLTAPQVSILLLIDKKGAMKISDIADELDMINSNVSNICSRLEKAGFIVRKRLKDDQRVVKVELTDDAKHKMAEIKASADAFYKCIEENVSQKDFEEINTGLVKLNKLFDLFCKNKK